MDKLGIAMKELGSRSFGDSTEKTFQINKSDGKSMITPEEIRKIVTSIEKQAEKKGDKIRLMIRGLNGTRRFTLKGFDEELNVMDDDEYFEGKAKDVTKFTDFFQVQITVEKTH